MNAKKRRRTFEPLSRFCETVIRSSGDSAFVWLTLSCPLHWRLLLCASAIPQSINHIVQLTIRWLDGCHALWYNHTHAKSCQLPNDRCGTWSIWGWFMTDPLWNYTPGHMQHPSRLQITLRYGQNERSNIWQNSSISFPFIPIALCGQWWVLCSSLKLFHSKWARVKNTITFTWNVN